MLQPNIFADPARLPILVLCVLASGFMVRFLIAIAAELGKPAKGIRKISEITGAQPLRCGDDVNPAGQLALGVIRINSSLISNSSRSKEKAAADRDLIGLRARTRTIDPVPERRYRRQ